MVVLQSESRVQSSLSNIKGANKPNGKQFKREVKGANYELKDANEIKAKVRKGERELSANPVYKSGSGSINNYMSEQRSKPDFNLTSLYNA